MSISINGTNGLTFNDGSSQQTAWVPGMRNRIINGDMRIDQRNAGASVTTSFGSRIYAVDRFAAIYDATSKFTMQQGSTTPPVGFVNYLRVTSSSAYSATSGQAFLFEQLIEGNNIADLGWGSANAKTITLSFWVRSSLTGTFAGAIENASNARSYVFTYTINAANTFEYKTITISGDTSGTWATDNGTGIKVRWDLGSGSSFQGTVSTWNSGDKFTASGATAIIATNGATWDVTGVQLEKGSTATSFDYRPYGTELALCQRYYQVFYGSTGAINLFGRANSTGGGNSYPIAVPLKVSFRASPTGTIIGTWAATNAGQPSIRGTNTDSVGLVFDASTTGDSYVYPNSSSVGVSFSAEL